MRPRTSLRKALADPKLLGNVLKGESWQAWRIILTAALGEPLTPDERKVFKQFTQRDKEPGRRVDELCIIAGRRSGKTRATSALASYIATLCIHESLVPGEQGIILCFAQDRRRATVLLDYVEANISGSPMLSQLITNRTQDSLSLSNKVSIVVRSSDWRRLRGLTLVAALCDELGFFRDESENSSNADTQILAAVRPGLATTQGPLVMFSSPHSKRGELFKIYEEHFGKDERDILVAHGASRDFNKTLPQSVVTRALERDAAAASAEYLAQFRTDVDTFIDRDVVLAAVSPGRFELPPLPDVSYVAFTDAAGGSGGDSFTLAICHIEGQRVVLDLLRDRHPPFAPDAVVQEFAATLKSYRISTVTGDRYASLWPRERFAVHDITYRVADSSKSDFYIAFLPLVNSGRVDLLDSKKLISQLCSLERRTARGGKDSVDHPSNGHDDLVNSVAGAVVTAVRRSALKDVPIVQPIVVSAGAREFPGGYTPSLPPSSPFPFLVNPTRSH